MENGNELLLINDLDILIRLLVSAVLGALIGIDRERNNQPAGLRTHAILCTGSTLAMIVSINLSTQFRPVFGVTGDPARLAAQVVSGIGFLGAGAILRFGNNIRGLTTATSLWTLAIVGLAVGAGHYLAAVGTTVILLTALVWMDKLEKRFIKVYKTIPITLQIENRTGILNEVKRVILDESTSIINTSITRDMLSNDVTINLLVKTLEEPPIEQMEQHLASLQGIKSFKINQSLLE